MAEDLLKRRATPLAVLHRQTTSLLATHGVDFPRGERLYGLRGTFRPTMAARTIQRLGDVRHALAQRCIAGTLEVHAPFAPALTDEAKDLVGKIDDGRKAGRIPPKDQG
ncbi:MAG: hypothetical protein KC656_01265 [Myxococcales bacterium]|nr:hypothetical protein [Myxococcales bacterium]MCB9670668.1 hypothetical protein [Alphaproteobacteria bacterium]MCB9693770.1 hypothetical protein [Alphaproteobacteria bacterium]